MKIKTIDTKTYESFVKMHEYRSLYQSDAWKRTKEAENKICELVGLYSDDALVGVSLLIYLRVLKKKKFAYASRGFVYDYANIPEFKIALQDYFKKKDVVFVRIDPPIILATYDKKLNRDEKDGKLELIHSLQKNGFKHFGFNMAAEAFQFRFVHRLTLKESYEKQLEEMSKSTRKNIDLAYTKGVRIKKVDANQLDEVFRIVQFTVDRKEIVGLSKNFYENLLKSFKEKITMYIVYIDKSIYLDNLDKKLNEAKKNLMIIEEKMQHDHVGNKLRLAKEQAVALIEKCQNEIEDAKKLDDITNIASMLTITMYDEVVSLVSGMNNDFRSFCPKYVMYPEMIKDAFQQNLKYVNFLGVKNILDPNDKDHGVYEIKRGFGGETIEYIGEFDLPIQPFYYFIYDKLRKKK